MKEKKLVWATGIVFVLILIFGGILIFEQENNSVKIGYKKHLAYLPLFVALEKRYFEDVGLDTKVEQFDSTNLMVSAVISRHIDAVFGGTNLETVYNAEAESSRGLKIISTSSFNEGQMFTCALVKKDSSIQSYDDLKGKKAGTLKGSFAELWIKEALVANGLNQDNLEIIGISRKLHLSSLESGQIDVLFTVEPVCSFGINSGTAKLLDIDPMRYLSDLFAVSIMSSKFSKDNNSNKVIEVYDKAIDFIRSNPEESLEIMAKYTGYKEELIKDMNMLNYSKSNEVNVDALQDLANNLYLEGNVGKQVAVRTMI